MLRLLMALLSLVAAPLGVPASSPDPGDPHEAHHVQRAPSELVLDASAMPGERGWFLVPVRAAGPTLVEVEAKHKLAPDRGRLQAAAIVVGAPSQGAWASGVIHGAWRDAEVDADGRRVTCCQQATTRAPFGAGSLTGGFGGPSFWLGEGETLWVGLVAYGWTPGSKLKVTLHGYDHELHAGRAVTGTTVDAVDLADEARRAGVGVRVGGQRLAGHADDAARQWSPAGTGFLFLDAAAQGDATARLTAALPGQTLHAGEDLHDEYVGVLAFQRGGTFRVALEDLYERGVEPTRPDARYSAVQARALYADLSVPLEGLQAWHEAMRFEDDDW